MVSFLSLKTIILHIVLFSLIINFVDKHLSILAYCCKKLKLKKVKIRISNTKTNKQKKSRYLVEIFFVELSFKDIGHQTTLFLIYIILHHILYIPSCFLLIYQYREHINHNLIYFNEVISILRRGMGQSNACIPPQTPTDKHATGFVFSLPH